MKARDISKLSPDDRKSVSFAERLLSQLMQLNNHLKGLLSSQRDKEIIEAISKITIAGGDVSVTPEIKVEAELSEAGNAQWEVTPIRGKDNIPVKYIVKRIN